MKPNLFNLVLVRHGHSEWNLSDRFTGWTDIKLTSAGLDEAARCGELLASHGFIFDEVHVSALQRTKQTADQLLRAAAHHSIPCYSSWRLNERHYGSLQGMNKHEIFSSWGEQRSRAWWRGYLEAPPPLLEDDPRHPCFDIRYADIDPALLPRSESLRQCQQRLIPYWQEVIQPRILSGHKLLIISHGNTLRALRMLVENIDPADIEQIEIPSAEPLIYQFDHTMTLQNMEWLMPLTTKA